jgi:hypothetical protein
LRFAEAPASPSSLLLSNLLRAAVAQVVERSPEKAGVGGSTPSRGTIPFNHPQTFSKDEIFIVRRSLLNSRIPV